MRAHVTYCKAVQRLSLGHGSFEQRWWRQPCSTRLRRAYPLLARWTYNSRSPKDFPRIFSLWYGPCNRLSCTLLSVSQNPLAFLLRASQIYPNKLAIAHSNVEQPVFYTYSVWYVSNSPNFALLVLTHVLRAQRVQNLAYALIEAGIQPGDRVAVLAPNS